MDMAKIKAELSGVFPPMMTPFNADQTLNLNALKYNLELYNETGIRGIMPLGSNGEFASLTDEESIAIVKIVKETLKTDKTLMVGVGRESAYHTVEFVKRVTDIGVQYVSVLTPHYYKDKMTDDALFTYFVYIADRSPVPILVYNAPKFSSDVCISRELTSRLASHPNIVGMKDTSGEDIAIYVEAAKGENFYVLAGSINKYMYALECGAVGGVLSVANYLPQQCSMILPLFEMKSTDEARKLAESLKAITSACSGKAGIPGSKACMTLMGYKGGYPRLPLAPLREEEVEATRQVLYEAGYIVQ